MGLTIYDSNGLVKSTSVGTDADAIHDNVGGEINAITSKGTPVGADLLVIEDSADSFNKKKVTISSMPAGSEVNNLASDGIAGIADDQVAVGTGAGTAGYQTLPNGAVSYNTTTGAFSQASSSDLSDGPFLTAEDNDLATDGVLGIADDQLVVGTGAGAAAYKTLANGALAYNTTTNAFAQAGAADLSNGVTGSGAVVLASSPTIDTPVIGDFSTSQHDHNDASGGGTLNSGATPSAIHDDTAGEIAAVTLKASPVSGDLLLIEDSAAANVKKRITIGSLPAGGEVNNLAGDGISGIADDQLAVGTGAGTAAYKTLSNGAVSYNTTTNAFSQAGAADLSNGVTGSGAVVLASSPTITTPTVASFANAGHNHQDAAGGGTLASAATPSAIHDDVAGEFAAITLKASPVSGDLLLIEDSAAANAKKYVTIGSLPAGGETNNLASDGIAGIADDQLAVGTGAGTAAYKTMANGAMAYNTSTNAFSQASSADLSDSANIVKNNQANTWSTGAQDMGGASSFEVPNGAGGTTIDAAGEVCVDTTARRLHFHDGTAEVALNPLVNKSFFLENPVAADDLPVMRFEQAGTLVKVVFAIQGLTNWVGQLVEASDAQGTGDTNTQSSDNTVTGTTTITTFSNGGIAAGNYVRLKTTSVSGSSGWLHVTFYYREDA